MNNDRMDKVAQRLREIILKEAGVKVEPRLARELYAVFAAIPPGDIAPMPGEGVLSREVTVVITDLRGFSSISEALPSLTVFEILNHYLSRMCEIAFSLDGYIDKFMGDGVMLLFGAPTTGEDDVRRAVTCAVRMQVAMDDVNRELAEKGLPVLFMGAGVNTGVVTAGMIGSALHAEYTVIGEEVNVASRIETFCLRGQVLISEATYRRCQGYLEVGEPMEVLLKGKSSPQTVREVFGIPSLDLAIPRRDMRQSPRVETVLPFNYYLLDGKVVLPQAYSGVTLDISYHGMLAEVGPGLSLHADIKIELDLSLAFPQQLVLYGKVRGIRLDNGRQYAGIEFTSLGADCEQAIRRFVQLLIQGVGIK